MKKKVLSALLAAALFVGMAVPAFADFYSSVEGDATKASSIDFYKDGKVITELKIAEGEDEDIANYVRVFEDKDTLILDKSYLDYTLEGSSLAFGINGSTVNAIDKSGSATVVVTSTLNSKIVGKLKVTAAPSAEQKNATGFKFKSTTNTVITESGAENSTIKVVSVPSGSAFDATQKSAIDAVVIAALENVTSHYTVVGNTAFNNTNTLTVTGLPQGKTITFKTAATGAASSAPAASAAWNGDVLEVTVAVASDATAGTISVAAVQAAIRAKAPTVTISNKVTAGSAPISTITTPAAGDVGVSSSVSQVKATVASSTFDDNNATLVYTVPAAGAASLLASVKKTLKVEADIIDGNNGATVRTVNASTTVQNVAAKAAIAIGAPGSITIEVGEVYDTDGKLSFGPSGANVSKGYSLSLDYINSDADALDYATVDGLKILGVKTGTNKVVASLNSDGTKTATIVVKVVAKGTKPVAGDMKLSATSATLEVGGTSYITVSNVPENADVKFAIDNSNATIVAGKGAVKIFAKKVGTATVTCTVNGEEVGKIAVTVKAASTTPSNPGATNNPQTGDSIFAGLF